MNHETLMSILAASEFGYPLLDWIQAYLLNTLQWVKILLGSKSRSFIASSEVPQGGHLSSILFSLFINSVSSVLRYCYLLCFADDIKIFLKIDIQGDWINLQEDLDRFVKWAESIGLSLNIDKFKSTFIRSRSPLLFSYSIKGTILTSIDNVVCDHGFIFNPSLCPRTNIDHIMCKAIKI